MHDEKMPQLIQNQARWDRILRFALGAALFGLGLSGLFTETVGAALRVVSIIPFATAGLGWCPLYEAIGVSTRRAGLRQSQPPPEPGTESPFAGGGAIAH
jgi:hypothetical protein